MQLKEYKWLVLLMVLNLLCTRTFSELLRSDDDYYSYNQPDTGAREAEMDSRVVRRQAEKGPLYSWPLDDYDQSWLLSPYGDSLVMEAATECEPETGGDAPGTKLVTPPIAPVNTETTTECVPETADDNGNSMISSMVSGTVASSVNPTATASPTVTTTEVCEEEEEEKITTEGALDKASAKSDIASSSVVEGAGNTSNAADPNPKAKELQNIVQHIYVAQARVQLEATEIRKAQAVANSAQQQLEDAATKVRTIMAQLQTAQQEVAAAAIRSQTAQLQLAAHDQLLFAARQDVDALSSEMVGLQAAEGFTQPKPIMDLSTLLERLKQPLSEADKPTAVPSILPISHKPKTQRLIRNKNNEYGEITRPLLPNNENEYHIEYNYD